MATTVHIQDEDDFFIGEDFVIYARAFETAGRSEQYKTAKLRAAAESGASSLSIEALKYALSTGDKLLFTEGFMVKIADDAALGANSLTVEAIAGDLALASLGKKVKDVSALTLTWVLEDVSNADSPVNLATVAPTLVDDPADPDGTPMKIAQIAIAPSDTASLTPGKWLHRYRETAPSVKTLCQGDAVLKRR